MNRSAAFIAAPSPTRGPRTLHKPCSRFGHNRASRAAFCATVAFALITFSGALCPSIAENCHSRTLGETESAIIKAAAKRFRALGVVDISYITEVGGPTWKGRMFLLAGAKASMAISNESGIAKEVRFALSSPSGPADKDVQASMAAFLVARYSGENEQAIRAQILNTEETLADGANKLMFFKNDAVAAISRTGPQDIVLSVGQFACN